MLKLAICEDNDIQCRQIHTLSCSSLEIPVEIDTFSSATDFLNQISNEQCPYHIILMDIELGSESVSGIKLAQRINLLNPNTQIIFISQYLQYASSVYETDHIYFVYKQQNHLFSLAYLIDMKKTDAAEKYCNSVLSNNIDHNNHTSVCKSLNQEDSIL